MNRDRLERVEGMFHKARVLPASDRAAFLDSACDGDLPLRREVESLLAHSDAGTTGLNIRGEMNDATELVDRGDVVEAAGTRIGNYKLLQQIGEGGFGVVYMAEQQAPVRRKVALKIIKLGMDTKQVIARFEAERQALAMMDHPNIARVLDAGATETGRPYFVMELVRGVPVTEYCDDAKLSPKERLRLFIDICHAVQHAHQKGVIHRDIKPSNVLVTLHDDRPVPKIIDFGIAKATSHRLTEKTLFTEFRQFIGTPEYMSPDQAEISGLDVDTRTDIYSLGVLLYELLTGTTPFDPETLRASGHVEMQRIIREVDPPIPSTRVTAMGRRRAGGGGGATEPPTSATRDVTTTGEGSLEMVAHRRRVEAPLLSKLLRGDLDWVVMKAMEKDRTRRYQTAIEMAADVERYLTDQPVHAGRPSAAYRLRKFARRHRVGITAGGLIAAAIVAGVTLAGVGFVRANQEARRSQAVSTFLQSLILNLDEASDRAGGAAGLSPAQIVERGRELFGDDPAVMGTLLRTRASSLATAGRVEEAIGAQRGALASFREAFEGEHATVAGAMFSLAELLEDRGDLVEAESLYRESLSMRRSLNGLESPLTAETLARLVSMLTQREDQSRHAEIKSLWTDTVRAFEGAFGPRHARTARQLCERASWVNSKGYTEEAIPLLAEAVDRAEGVLPDEDLTYFMTLNSYAQYLLVQTNQYEAGVEILKRMKRMANAMWGPHDAMSLAIGGQIATFSFLSDEEEAAVEALLGFVADRRAAGVRQNVSQFAIQSQVFSVMQPWLKENPQVGRELALYVVEDGRAVLGNSPARYSDLLQNIGAWLRDNGYATDAVPILEERLSLARSGVLEDEGEPAGALIALGELLVRVDRVKDAERLLRECVALRREAFGESDWRTVSARAGLGWTLARQDRFAEAEPLLLDAYEGLRGNLLAPMSRQADVREFLARMYEEWGRPEKAARYRSSSEPNES